MGCDIHWLIERRHPEGGWHAVLWGSLELRRYFPSDGSQGLEWDFNDPAIAFGMRSYVWFGILSALRLNEDGPHLATEGYPDDVSAFAEDVMGDDGDLHSHGYIGLGELRRSVSQDDHPVFCFDPEAPKVARYYLDTLDKLIARHAPTGPCSILAGFSFDESVGEYRIDPSKLSNHERMRLARLETCFPPPRDEDFRLIVAYDN